MASSTGYGTFSVRRGTQDYVTVGAHRFAYSLWKGPIPPEAVVHHRCENRHCVNPEHLEAVTYGENNRRTHDPDPEAVAESPEPPREDFGEARPNIERFMEKVDGVEGPGCWEWVAGTFWDGYGEFYEYLGPNEHRSSVRAHRFAYRYFRGEIPEGYVAHHECGNRSCVNPWHLEVLPKEEHNEHTVRPTDEEGTPLCSRGHPLTEENTNWVKKQGYDEKYAECRACNRLRKQKQRGNLDPSEYGVCPVCGLPYQVRVGGGMRKHGGCEGVGEEPVRRLGWEDVPDPKD